MNARAVSSSLNVVACPVHHVTADQANRLATMTQRRLNRSEMYPAIGPSSAYVHLNEPRISPQSALSAIVGMSPTIDAFMVASICRSR